MAEYRGTKYSRGHSFILARPAPGVARDSRIYAPPVTVPVELDREEWLREAITLLAVSSLLAMIGSRSALNPRLRGYWVFGGRTVVLAMLSGLVIPIPIVGPVAFQPMWLLTDSNHGVPGWLMMLVIWAVLSCVAYLVLGVFAFLLQRFVRHDPQISSRATA